MMNYIQTDVQKEVDDRLNTARIQATQILISYGDSLEQQHQEKLYHITNQFKKQEDMLKAEQDYLISSHKLNLENEFSNFLLDDIQKSLLEYTISHPKEYHQTLHSWIKKTHDALNNSTINFTVNATDIEIVKTITTQLSLTGDIDISTHVSAGFIAQTKDGVIVDLCFETLFNERKQQLLNISMQILKESL